MRTRSKLDARTREDIGFDLRSAGRLWEQDHGTAGIFTTFELDGERFATMIAQASPDGGTEWRVDFRRGVWTLWGRPLRDGIWPSERRARWAIHNEAHLVLGEDGRRNAGELMDLRVPIRATEIEFVVMRFEHPDRWKVVARGIELGQAYAVDYVVDGMRSVRARFVPHEFLPVAVAAKAAGREFAFTEQLAAALAVGFAEAAKEVAA